MQEALNSYVFLTSVLAACDGDSNSNNAPSISGNPAGSVAQGSSYIFAPTATDSDADDILIFSISNPPSWANFSAVTGVLSGTPAASDAGTTTNNIVISVSDGMDSAVLPVFSVTVTSGSSPIAVDDNNIVGNEDSVSTIAVLANDTDVDGDTLSIASVTQPANGDVSISGTNITYTPNANFIGTDNFVYQIADVDGQTSIENGSITVTNGGSTGTVALSWLMPSTREDATSISPSEIGGYRIYHGTRVSNLTLIATITNSSITEYTAGSLAAGIHYFSVTTYDTYGSESDYSNIEEKLID